MGKFKHAHKLKNNNGGGIFVVGSTMFLDEEGIQKFLVEIARRHRPKFKMK